MSSSGRDLIFISYSREDFRRKPYLQELQIQLKGLLRGTEIQYFVDEQTETGVEWRREIFAALDRTKVAVLLVGPGFLASDFVQDIELPRFLKGVHEKEGVKIAWVPVRASSVERAAPEVWKFQAAWHPDKPLDDLSSAERNRAMKEIAEKIVDLATAIKGEAQQPTVDPLTVEQPFLIDEELRSIRISPLLTIKSFATESDWTQRSNALAVDAPLAFEEWLIDQKGRSVLAPKWRGVFTPESSKDPAKWDTLERTIAKVYPRYRDAHLDVYMCLHRAPQAAASTPELLKHSKSIMMGLTRHYLQNWADPRYEAIWHSERVLAGETGVADVKVLLCSISLAHFGIVRRLWSGCDPDCLPATRDHHVRQAYFMLDRICYWMQQLHRWSHMVVLKSKPLPSASSPSHL